MKGFWVYSISYNCEDMVPHFLDHYGEADHIVVYDNGSTDRTRFLLKHNGVEVRPYEDISYNTLRDDIHSHLKNVCWKEARGKADWVVVVDFDEFLYHPNICDVLDRYKKEGVTLPLATAYEMVSDTFPDGTRYQMLTETVKRGRRNDLYSKQVIFDPGRIDDINYGPGGHNAKPTGVIKYSGPFYYWTAPVPPYPALILQQKIDPMNNNRVPPPDELKILHYRFVGKERIQRMWENYKSRMSQVNLDNRWGVHYFLPKEEQERVFQLLNEQAEQVI